jgi:hypothetical protein
LIQAAETKVDAKIATMNGLKSDMQGLLGQLDDKQQAEVDRMVKVFEAMKPKDAAPRFVLLSDDVRLPIAAKMKERALSAILANMAPADAKKLTESLSARFVAQADAARQAINPPAAQTAATAPPTAATAPAQTTTPPAEAAAAPAKLTPKPAVHRKPKAKAPAKTIAQNPPEPVWPPKPAAKPATATPAPAKTASATPAAKPAATATAAPPAAKPG